MSERERERERERVRESERNRESERERERASECAIAREGRFTHDLICKSSRARERDIAPARALL